LLSVVAGGSPATRENMAPIANKARLIGIVIGVLVLIVALLMKRLR
jgi:hypothetical protein